MLKEKIASQYKNNNLLGPSRELTYRITSFALDYLKYLIKQITPERILRLNGWRILAFLSDIPIVKKFYKQIMQEVKENYQKLTRNQKIRYYTLLEMGLLETKYYQLEIKEFYKRNKELMDSMKKELSKPFPLPTGKNTEMPYSFW